MRQDRPLTHSELISADNTDCFWEVEYPERDVGQVLLRPRAPYRETLGDSPIRVGIVEFRIMLFLASRPYHAFTRRQISDASSGEDHAVTEATVDFYIASLRDQLGDFHDFVQSVPQVGYRFKA
jgi:DNA-binding response OmpR family regulator